MSTSADREEDGKNYNCDTNTLEKEGYYLKSTFDDSLFELVNIEKRKRIQDLRQKGEEINESEIEFAVDVDFQDNEEFQKRVFKRRKAIQTSRSMRKCWLKNNKDYTEFKHDKELIGLKYDNIRSKVNFIQITVIMMSTIITFLETVKERFGLANNLSMTVAPILISTYIGLALAISRFFKLDDHKEELCKLDEAQAFIMSGLRHRMRDIERLKPLHSELTIDDLNQVEKCLDDQSKDGLEETIGTCKQKFDLAMDLSEKVYYKNILLKINLDKLIAEDNKKNIESHKEKLILHKYKKQTCFLWKYICCDCDSCRYTYIDEDECYKDAELFQDRKPLPDRNNNKLLKISKPPSEIEIIENVNNKNTDIDLERGESRGIWEPSVDYCGMPSTVCQARRRSGVFKSSINTIYMPPKTITIEQVNKKINNDNIETIKEDEIKETVNSLVTNIVQKNRVSDV